MKTIIHLLSGGIEIDPTHYRTAVERVRRELAQPTLAFEAKPQPKQEALL